MHEARATGSSAAPLWHCAVGGEDVTGHAPVGVVEAAHAEHALCVLDIWAHLQGHFLVTLSLFECVCVRACVCVIVCA